MHHLTIEESYFVTENIAAALIAIVTVCDCVLCVWLWSGVFFNEMINTHTREQAARQHTETSVEADEERHRCR